MSSAPRSKSARPRSKAASGNAAWAMAAPQLAKVFTVLSDPDTRAEIVAQAKAVNEAVSRWRMNRETQRKGSGEPRGGLSARFGQRGLEGRAAHLREMVETLGATSPALADSFAPVRANLDHLDNSLRVAARLPVVKRKLAHRTIDGHLDDLEKAVLAATLPATAAAD